MQYINTQTMDYPVSELKIKQSFANVSFPVPFTPPAGFSVVQPSPQPDHNPDTQTTEQVQPIKVGDTWTQQWAVRDLTAEEIKSRVPAAVTMRQARLVLLGAGLLGNIEAAINALPSPQKEAARIEWEYSQEVQRHNGFVSMLAPLLGLTEAQLDAMFISAAKL